MKSLISIVNEAKRVKMEGTLVKDVKKGSTINLYSKKDDREIPHEVTNIKWNDWLPDTLNIEIKNTETGNKATMRAFGGMEDKTPVEWMACYDDKGQIVFRDIAKKILKDRGLALNK